MAALNLILSVPFNRAYSRLLGEPEQESGAALSLYRFIVPLVNTPLTMLVVALAALTWGHSSAL